MSSNAPAGPAKTPGLPVGALRSIAYAQGYLALGLIEEARAELASLAEADRQHPVATKARMALHYAASEWPALEQLAQRYTAAHPDDLEGWINLAFAVRRTIGVPAAKQALLAADALFGATSALLHYNLACYHCVLGELEDARARLRRALKMDPDLKPLASEDEDLKPLQPEVDGIGS